MKFQIGDIITLKHTDREGKIVGIENEEMFLIDFNGQKCPVLKENVDEQNFDWDFEQKSKYKNLKWVSDIQKPKENISSGSQWKTGVYLSFFPLYEGKDSNVITSFKVYFVNHDRENVKLNYKLSSHHHTLFSTSIKSDSLLCHYLHKINVEQLHEIPQFDIGFEWNDAVVGEVKTKVDFKIRAKKLFLIFQQLNNGDLSFFSIPLDKNVLNNLSDQSFDVPIAVENKIEAYLKNKNRIEEVDIHIEKIAGDYSKLSNAEIIQIQLEHFDKVIHHAIALEQDSLTVIHGVGKGVLKEEIHSMLKMYKEVRHFLCEWSPKYGYGATQIFFYT